MKRTVYEAYTLSPNLSPITPGGQVVYSTIKTFSDPQDRTKHLVEELTPDAKEAFEVMRFLDEMNGISWTPELKRIERELRAALLDLAATDATEVSNHTE